MENRNKIIFLTFFIQRILYSLLLFTSVTVSTNADQVNELNANEMSAERFGLSHFSNAAKYAQLAYSASVKGNWHQARDNWEIAVEHLEQSEAPVHHRVVFYYEFGHAAGITCDFEIAEEFIEKSYLLEKSINGPYVLSLVELFRLYFDQQSYKMASIYFEAALPQLKASHADENTPIRYSLLLDEYADSLRHIGRLQLANKINIQSRIIRTTSNKKALENDRTRYGSLCDNNSKKTNDTIAANTLHRASAPTSFLNNRISKIRKILTAMKKARKNESPKK